MAAANALFRAFPRLASRVAHRPFLLGPTPVAPLPLAGVGEGALWLKDDARSARQYGGNKPRKLEFVIGEALRRGAHRLVTTGGLGTHHGLATTVLGREAGLATTLVLVDQPVTDAVRRTLALHAAWGATLVYGRGVAGTAARTAAVLAGAWLRGERPFLVATGGSSPRGSLGFVAAGLELGEQVRAGACPEPAEIWLAVGTGGSLAGLAVGLRLAGLRSRLRGVLVTDILPPTPARLLRLARAIHRLLARLEPSMPPVALAADDVALVTDQVGPGYGAPTEAAREAVARAAEAGLALETTYTGKCLAALLAQMHPALGARMRPALGARMRREPGRAAADPVLFWNTYSSVDVAAAAPRPPSEEALPEAFRRILARRPPGGAPDA